MLKKLGKLDVFRLCDAREALLRSCSAVSTDAAGYAAYIDQSYTHNILWLWLWLLMAVVFTGIAVVFRRTPVRRVIIRKNGFFVGGGGWGFFGGFSPPFFFTQKKFFF
ncbi:conjugal transfer protein TraP (plasmid) [Klebsiella pneumoniae]